MTIGNRIRELRKTSNYSQEYIAEELNVSRQAVSKWEQDISKPDTENLIRLAKLLHTSVRYLATGEREDAPIKDVKKKLTKRKKRNIVLISILSFLIVLALSLCAYIYTRPVDFDAGACGGGYATYIFDKYENELVQKFLDGMDTDRENVSSIEAIRGTHELSWEEKEIFLSFEVKYEHKIYGTVTHRLHFIGKRLWLDTFRWGGAIIEG